MHHLLLVTIAMSPGATSEETRLRAYSRLIEDDSFCGNGGLFGHPLSDWFVIGGRWSGHLRETLLGQPYQDALKQEFPALTNGYYPADLAILHKDGLDQLWHRFNGTDSNPMTRDSYLEYGYEDDALLVDSAVFNRFLKPVEGTTTCLHDEVIADFADLDGDEVDESFIGKKWLVAVDYHN